MDKIAKGMSEASQPTRECCSPAGSQKGFTEKVKELAKETSTKVKDYLKGRTAQRTQR